MRKFKGRKGITLIALVITIIVLLILSGVAITMITGDNGILNTAIRAKEATRGGEVKERVALGAVNKASVEYLGGTKNEKAQMKSELHTEKKLTDEEYEYLQESDVITIGGIEIDFSVLDGGTETGKLASEIFEATGTTEGKMHVGDYVNYPVYYDNVASYVDVHYNGGGRIYPKDQYVGWRVLAIEGAGENQYIKLVSAGVPLNYYHGYRDNGSAISIQNLTTRFFSTPINSTLTEFSFYNCGFKTGKNGTKVTNILDVEELFKNKFTAKYINNEIASYQDIYRDEEPFTNLEVEGIPKVRALSMNDLEGRFNLTFDEPNASDIISVPCKDIGLAKYWFPNASGNSTLWECNGGTLYDDSEVTVDCDGVRCVVLLNADVKYSLAEGSSENDEVKIWDIQ